ncbi:MAG TPA: protealysin inhibitor emfourin [Leptolyngbyaceae cyanobacterium]
MQITFERTGGFAGIRIAKNFDTDTLSTEEANQLRQLIEAADFFDLPSNINGNNSQRDRFQYKLIVEERDRKHAVVVNEQSVPANLKPLLEWLKTAAARGK